MTPTYLQRAGSLLALASAIVLALPAQAQERESGEVFGQGITREDVRVRAGADRASNAEIREWRAARQQQQQERQQQRQQRAEVRANTAVDAAIAPPARGDGVGTRSERRDGAVQRDVRRGDYGANTRREWRQESRDDRREWRQENRDDRQDIRQGYRQGRQADQRSQQDAYRDGYRNGRREDWRDDRRDVRQAYNRGYSAGDRSDDNRWGQREQRRWDHRGWRNDRRYDWYRYRAANRSLFSIGRYYAPYRDYRYRRISIGLRLGSPFYASRYWINDPWYYRLPPAYGPYRWVRYYDDALLVDTYSGEVVDVIYDFFW